MTNGKVCAALCTCVVWTLCANGSMRIPSQSNYRKCFSAADLTEPITMMPDVLGNPWPSKGYIRGSAYVLRLPGLVIVIR